MSVILYNSVYKFRDGTKPIPSARSIGYRVNFKLSVSSVANLAALRCVRFCFLTFLTRKIWLFEQTHKNA